MKKFLAAACAVLGGVSIAAHAAVAGTIADAHHWKPMFGVRPLSAPLDATALDRISHASATVPIWHASVTSPLDKKSYTFTMVGTSPLAAPATTTVSFVPIVLKVNFGGGIVLDPTKPGCGDTVSVESRFFKSPLFSPVNVKSNGVNVGPAQLVDAFQRANFWSLIKGSAKYHVQLASALATPIVLTVNAPAGSGLFYGVCSGNSHLIGDIEINAYDALVQSIVSKYAKPNQLPLLLSYNVFEYQGDPNAGCCILGYHSSYARSTGIQTYSVGAYNDAGVFSVPIEDIHAWTHEIGEWLDDPFGTNPTPAWGHIGQVSTCQNNLEVGDPLTGTAFDVALSGFTYHPQELTFLSWFYRLGATGTGGKYSFEGTFTGAQKTVCQ